jgi:hypothetical protein
MIVIAVISTALFGMFISGYAVWTFREKDVEARVKAEKHRLDLIERTTLDINKALSGSVLVGTYDHQIAKQDTQTLCLIRDIVYDIDLARRMRTQD